MSAAESSGASGLMDREGVLWVLSAEEDVKVRVGPAEPVRAVEGERRTAASR